MRVDAIARVGMQGNKQKSNARMVQVMLLVQSFPVLRHDVSPHS